MEFQTNFISCIYSCPVKLGNVASFLSHPVLTWSVSTYKDWEQEVGSQSEVRCIPSNSVNEKFDLCCPINAIVVGRITRCNIFLKLKTQIRTFKFFFWYVNTSAETMGLCRSKFWRFWRSRTMSRSGLQIHTQSLFFHPEASYIMLFYHTRARLLAVQWEHDAVVCY